MRHLVLALALLCATAACGASSGASSGTGAGGMGGTPGTGSGGSAGMPVCQINVLPLAPASFDGLVPGAGAMLRVQGQITGAPPAMYSWVWLVRLADGTPVAVTSVAGDASVVEFAMPQAGSYGIAVALAGGATPCEGRRTVVAAQPGGRQAVFRFRFTPPPDGEPVQEREIQVLGGTPTGDNVVVLAAGTAFSFAPVDRASGKPVGAYLRLTDPAQRLVFETHRAAGSGGGVTVKVAPGTFDLLVVPDGEALAPLLLPRLQAAELASMGALEVEAGEMVTGAVRDAGGAVAGATVVLRAGSLPSTLATTGADGRFTARARPGTYAVTITRPLPTQPASAAALEATLPADPGVVVAPGGPTSMDVTIAAYTTAALGMKLMPSDGGAVRTGTRVLLSAAAPAGLASVTVAGGTRAAAVRVRGELPPDGSGAVTVAGLPRARYAATVLPAAGMADAITVADVDLTAGDALARPVPLRRKVSMTGQLLPREQAAGLAVTAIAVSGSFPAAAAGTTDAAGQFNVQVDPERRYALRVRPGPDRPLAPALFGKLEVTASGLVVAAPGLQMRSALLFGGQVLDRFARNGSPATLIQVYCAATAPDCADPDTPLAETVTASDGSFQLRLPDPGVAAGGSP